MVSINKQTRVGAGPQALTEGVCLSTDVKPTDWDNGSTLLEMDTSKVFIYDEQNQMWREL